VSRTCPEPVSAFMPAAAALASILAEHFERILQGVYAREPQARGRRVETLKLFRQRGNALAVTVWAPWLGLRQSHTGQTERHIERRWRAGDDVGADSQPVRCQVRVADPRLQVPHERGPRWHDRPRRRQVQEVAIAQLRLRTEEIVVSGQDDRGGEGDVELDL